MPDLFLIPSGAKDYVIDKTYSDAALSIQVDPPNLRVNWYKAGYLKILLPIFNKWVPISNKAILLTWEQVIEIPYKNYRLSFSPEVWLESPNVIINSYLIEYNPMGINYGQVEKQTGAVVDTSIAGSATTFQVLPVDLLRHEGTIYNRTNRILYIKWGTAAATAADLAVPAGSNIDIPEDYTGAVQGICAAGVSGAVLSQTISFI
jgi:hypothetical protein